MFTTIEGEWDEVMGVIKRVVDVVARESSRVGLMIQADFRPGYAGRRELQPGPPDLSGTGSRVLACSEGPGNAAS